MNTNSLPVALMQSLVLSIPNLRWGDDDTTGAMTGRAFTYLVLYSSFSMMVRVLLLPTISGIDPQNQLRWSWGVHLLSVADDAQPVVQLDERTPLLPPFSNDPRPSSSTLVEINSGPPTSKRRYIPPRRRTTFFKSLPNSSTQERAQFPSVDSTSSSTLPSPTPSEASDSDTEVLPVHHPDDRPPSSFHRARRRLRRGWVAFNNFMTVPLWATLASLIVACIPPLQYTLDNHMKPIKGALTSAGNCSIPLTLVVLGAFFYDPPSETNGTSDGGGALAFSASRSADSLADQFKDLVFFKRSRMQRHSEPATAGETKTIVIAITSRMLITPLLLMPLMVASAKFDWHKVLEE